MTLTHDRIRPRQYTQGASPDRSQMPGAPRLSLSLLGPFRAVLGDGSQPAFRTDKLRALLAYLAIEADQPHRRESLATLLWPEMPEQAAHNNLRKSLHRLRAALGPTGAAVLSISRQTVQLNSATVDVDVNAFEDKVRAARTHAHRRLFLCQDCQEQLTHATRLYRGEFLAGFGLAQAMGFEEWLGIRREALRQQAVWAWQAIADAQERRGQFEAVLEVVAQILAVEPWRESAHQQAMRALSALGRRSRALAQYGVCRQVLQQELGVEPGPETRALYERVRGQPEAGARPARLHHFPRPFTPLIGRGDALAQLADQLLDPDCRWVTLVGPGGVGKTRLSAAAGELAANWPDFADGLYFVPLASATSTDMLVSAVGTALGLAFRAQSEPARQVIDYLRDRRVLLVLDNCEQVLGAAAWLVELLSAAAGLKLLATSRLPFSFRAEWQFPLAGLAYPTAAGPVASAAPYAALQLFIQTASRFAPGFAPAEAELTHITSICRLVQGLPLAIEMAAASAPTLGSEAVAREIAASPDFLKTPLRDMPERHRSLRAVWEQSWRLLAADEQTLLGGLSVFAGSFSDVSALTVAGATPAQLGALADQYWLAEEAPGRYRMHELLRQFAAEKLATLGAGAAASAHAAYGRHYLELVRRLATGFAGPAPQQAAAALQLELDNVLEAWSWAVSDGRRDWLEASLDGLAGFFQFAGLYYRGESVLAEALRRIPETMAPSSAARLLTRLKWQQAELLIKMGRYAAAEAAGLEARAGAEQQAWPLMRALAQTTLGELWQLQGQFERALAELAPAWDYFQQQPLPVEAALASARLGGVYLRQRNYAQALQAVEMALALDQAAGHTTAIGRDLIALGTIAWEKSEFEQALDRHHAALRIFRELGNREGIARCLHNIGLTCWHMGDYERAQQCLSEAFDLIQDLGHRQGMAACLGVLGLVLEDRGDYDQARVYLERSHELWAALGDRAAVSRQLNNLGHLAVLVGDYAQALRHIEQALAIDREIDNRQGVAIRLISLGDVYRELGHPRPALAYYDQALELLDALDARYYLSLALICKARAWFELGDMRQAQTANEQGLAIARAIGKRDQDTFEGEVLAARLLEAGGARAAATARLQELLLPANARQAADVHFELWRIEGTLAYARMARAEYETLYSRTPRVEFKRRLARLRDALPD